MICFIFWKLMMWLQVAELVVNLVYFKKNRILSKERDKKYIYLYPDGNTHYEILTTKKMYLRTSRVHWWIIRRNYIKN